MKLELDPEAVAARARFRSFVEKEILPFAGTWDRERELPASFIKRLVEAGLLGTPLPREVGGQGLIPLHHALLVEEIGRGCSSVRSLLTVHDMVALTVARWGSRRLQADVLPGFASGTRLAALGLSEPKVGSDPSAVEMRAERDGESYLLTGTKTWTTFGEIADEILVLARTSEGQLAAFLVAAESPGLLRRPLRNVVGTRASRLAELTFTSCRVAPERLLGRVGFGLSHVISSCLDHGRFSVACGAVGIAQACLDACLSYSEQREQAGGPIRRHQLIQRRLTNMIVETRAARLLCWRAAYLRSIRDPSSVPETMIAKYFASRAATRAAQSAVQLHGAKGLTEECGVERYLRDAQVTEIIEGSTEIQQISIPQYSLAEL